MRTPTELVRHMTSVLGYARTFFPGGSYRPHPLPDLNAEIARLHVMIEDLGRLLEEGAPLRCTTEERLLHGPLAMLRRRALGE